MELFGNEPAQITTRNITSEGQTISSIPENKHKMKPIFPRALTLSRKIFPSPKDHFRRIRQRVDFLQCTLQSFYYMKNFRKGLNAVQKYLNNFRPFQKFRIEYPNFHQEAIDMSFYRMSKLLKRPFSLPNFELCFENCKDITDKGLYYLGLGLRRFRSLKSFGFSLGNTSIITDQGLIHLSQKLKKLTCLERLALGLKSFWDLTDMGVSPLSASLKNLLLLKSLTLHLEADITEKGVLDLCNALEKLVCLQNLDLSLEGADMTDAVMKGYGNMLKKLVSLRSLSVALEDYEATKLGRLDFFEGLEKLVHLQSLKIDAKNDSMNMMPLYLGRALRKLVGLKHLEVKIYQSLNKNQGLAYLCNGLEALKSLEKFGLEIKYNSKINGRGLCLLARTLKKLALLQEVEMILKEAKDITDLGGQDFCREVKSLSNLRILNLTVPECLSNRGLYAMSQILNDLPSLESFCCRRGYDRMIFSPKTQSLGLLGVSGYFGDFKGVMEEEIAKEKEKQEGNISGKGCI